VATVEQVAAETGQVRTLTLAVPGWPGHSAGQHLEVRLTADDGYQASREYSLASAPGEPVAITVERLDDGEVSPYLTQVAQAGDQMEVRGPIGSYFTWEPGSGGPLMLIAGGSGIAPLRSILRHRERSGSPVPVRLLYSARTRADVIYAGELARPGDGVSVTVTLTREQPPPGGPGPAPWAGAFGRVSEAMLREAAWPASSGALAYVCGPTGFVETAATGLVSLGYPADRVRAERFGATA
jgi:ferredoxin-NADP reductase